MTPSSNPLSAIWNWSTVVDRKTYALVGFLGFAIKHNIDRYIAREYLYLSGGVFNYWEPLGKAARLTQLSYSEKHLLLALSLVALPFIWVGVAMTVGRLRDAAQPLWLVCLFFVPFLNVPFLLLLCLLPSKSADPLKEAAPWPKVRRLDRFIPRGSGAAVALSTLVTTGIGVLFFELGINLLRSYGWSLFVALPFCMGLFSVLLYGYHQPRSFGSCLEVSIMPIILVGFVIEIGRASCRERV